MPNRWPISSGNWSDSAIWSGSLIPTASDDVFANNRAVYIDQNITVRSLRNSATGSAVAGGSFYLNNNITASLTAANPIVPTVANIPLIIISASNSARLTGTLNVATSTGTMPVITMLDSSNLTISGSFTGAAAGQATNLSGSILHNSSGSLIITGSVTANAGGSSLANAISMLRDGSTYITGSLTSGNGGNGIVKAAGSGSIFIVTSNLTNIGGNNIVKSSFGNIDITGNITVSATIIINSAPGTIRVNGNLIGGGTFFNLIQNSGANTLIIVTGSVSCGTNTAHGILNTGANSIIIVTGSISGGTTAGATQAGGISLQTNPATVIVTGSISAGSGNGIQTTTASTIIVSGSVSSSILASGVSSTSTTAVNLFTGPFYNTGSFNAVYAYRMQMIEPTSTSWRFDTEVAGGSKTLYTANQLPGVPRQTDVRKGTQYNFGLTGSLEMPDPTTVKQGVAIDNTTGSAILTAQDMFNVLTQDIITTGSIGETLENVSTVQTVAATISAFKV